MNVLILTPDAVGSTLLQRLITIYMQVHAFDRPVINLHELTNGLVRYHSDYFHQDVLGKPETAWGYHQSLAEITALLSSVDHYKTSRLAQYHIRARKDTLEQQIPFYRYLNDNFFIIACRRLNVFEHGLSWGITKITKKLNVYSGSEKVESFLTLFHDGIDLDPTSLVQTLENYKVYLAWCEDHFDVASYFHYEQDIPEIEKYILNLPIFGGQPQKLTWQDQYGMDFSDWNRCHYLQSDLGTLALEHRDEFAQLTHNAQYRDEPDDPIQDEQIVKDYNDIRDQSWPTISGWKDYLDLPSSILKECVETHQLAATPERSHRVPNNTALVLPPAHQEYLAQYQQQYDVANQQIDAMVKQRIMVTPPPIKKQTLAEKYHMIKNFDQLLDVYNNWIYDNPEVGEPLSMDQIQKLSGFEQHHWRPPIRLTGVATQRLTDQSSDSQ
jgi:hypothetical protein